MPKLNKKEREAVKQINSAGKVEITHVATPAEVASKVFASESRAVIDAVQDAMASISASKQAIIENTLAIGERLLKLRMEIGSDAFGRFTAEVAPTLGISKSNCYKLMGNAEVLRKAVPNAKVRSLLLTSTEGRGIVAYQQEKDGQTVYAPALTPAAESALKAVGNPPKSDDEAACRDWANAFTKAVRKQRAEHTAGSSIAKDRKRLYAMLLRYGKRHGAKQLELFITAADSLLTAMDAENELPKSFDAAVKAARHEDKAKPAASKTTAAA